MPVVSNLRPTSVSFSIPERIFLAVLALYGALAAFALALAPLRLLPAEDAVILFQYSRNLAQHGAITYLAGGPHVEGATDFAWMLLLALGDRCGVPAFWCSAILNAIALLVLSTLLLRLAGLPITPRRILTVAGAAALFPQVLAAASGFAVLEDALLLTLLVYFVTRAFARRTFVTEDNLETGTNRDAVGASLTALVFCLFRPDGVVFALPLLVCLLRLSNVRTKTLLWIATLFVAPGVLYFLWRWHYFGELFPLPFLVKSNAERVFGPFVAFSVRTSLIFVLFTAITVFPVARLRTRMNLWFIAALVLLPTAFYWTVRLDQDVAYRFFYYLPLGGAMLLAIYWPILADKRVILFRSTLIAWLVLIAMPASRSLRTLRDEQFPNRKAIAEQLSRAPQSGTLLVSEAGFLPYFSGWPTLDAWGLNTPQFAHRFLQPSDIERLHPDLILVHPEIAESCVPRAGWQSAYPTRTWPHLGRNLVLGATRPDYELWLTPYGSEFYRTRKHWSDGQGDRECWFVRKDTPFYSAIVAALASHHGVAPSASTAMERAR